MNSRMQQTLDLACWRQVPGRVVALIKEAAPVTMTVRKILPALRANAQPDYGYVFWHPDQKKLWAVLGDGDDQAMHNKWSNALKAITGVRDVVTTAEQQPPNSEDWIRIKTAADAPLGLSSVNPFEWGGKLTGGPSPMSNALVGGLLAGGVGYGAGTFMENMLPERYLERGKLRKNMALLGAGLGTLPGVWQRSVNAHNATQAGQPMSFWESLHTPHANVPINPGAIDTSNHLGKIAFDRRMQEMTEDMAGKPLPGAAFMKAAAEFVKLAGGGSDVLRSVPVDAFNQAIWNDVSRGLGNPYGTKSPWGDNTQDMHTPPPIGAAATGLVSGIQQLYGGSDLLSPKHFITGLAAAGLDLARARLAGGVLGALGGLTPAAQNKLQEMGLWGGFIRGSVGSALGL